MRRCAGWGDFFDLPVIVVVLLIVSILFLLCANCIKRNDLCEIDFADGTRESIPCYYAAVEGSVLEISTKDGKIYKPLAAIKSFRTVEVDK